MPPAAHAGPKEDARAEALYKEVRCVVCQSESIADSDAAIAGDMRDLIRQAIAAGESDAAIRKDLYDRYGDYVLFRPRASKANLVLWAVPPLIVIAGVGALVWLARRRREEPQIAALTPDEEARLREIMKQPE